MNNIKIGTRIKVNKVGHPFHNKRGIVVGISPMDENRMLCRFPHNSFTFGFDKKELTAA